MQGPGKYIFDIGCEQHGEYISVEQVLIVPFLIRVALFLCFLYSLSIQLIDGFHVTA